jgi:hypothetical protein
MRTHVTYETLAIKARSAAVACATASMSNAEGGRFTGSPSGLGSGGAQGFVAGSLRAGEHAASPGALPCAPLEPSVGMHLA